jgi:hypothetical protein
MDKKLQSIHLRPLPPMLALNPPLGVLNLFKEKNQISSLNLSSVPEETGEEDSTYKSLYL